MICCQQLFDYEEMKIYFQSFFTKDGKKDHIRTFCNRYHLAIIFSSDHLAIVNKAIIDQTSDRMIGNRSCSV